MLKRSWGYWNDKHTQKEFLEAIGKKLGIECTYAPLSHSIFVFSACCAALDDWNGVTVKQVLAFGGAGLLFRYQNSLMDVLSAMYL